MAQMNGNGYVWTPPEATVSGVYGHGWEITKRYFLELFILTIIVSAAWIPIGMASEPHGMHSAGRAFLKLFAFAYWLMIFTPIDFGVLYGFVKGARGQSPDVNDIFKVTENYVHVVLTRLVVSVIVGIGLVALLIPGIYFACRLVLAPYLVVEEKLEVSAALRKSWDLTYGRAGTVFLMGLTAIPIAILGLLFCGVGILFSMVWLSAAFASFYVALVPNEDVNKPAEQAETDLPPVPEQKAEPEVVEPEVVEKAEAPAEKPKPKRKPRAKKPKPSESESE